jgi:hypothetical protein
VPQKSDLFEGMTPLQMLACFGQRWQAIAAPPVAFPAGRIQR